MIADLRWFKWPSLSKNKKPALSRLYLSDPEVSPGSAFSSPAWNCSLTQTARPQFLSCLLVPRFLANPSWIHNFTGQFPAVNCLQDPPSKLQASPTAGLVAQTPNQDPETWVFGGGSHSQRKFLAQKRAQWMFVHLANRWSNCCRDGSTCSPSQPPPRLPHHQIHNQAGTLGRPMMKERFSWLRGPLLNSKLSVEIMLPKIWEWNKWNQ